MKEVRILTLDSRGRIVIPLIIRKALSLEPHSQIMLISDSDSKTITIRPVGLMSVKNPVQYKITMEDSPGALGKLATTFGKQGISLIYGEALTLEKGKTALWTVIGPYPENITLEELKKILIEQGDALDVDCAPLD
ncbi:MAG: hypothetical protein ACTSR8_16380 [Promethearchaeota archaeon]